ncbi:MAG: hypothetical protein HRK26_01460 [Rickettsiaceae bacterium H1]|nr:hypothetical protein [Rickettsiaceae bacterium H1]
MNFLINVYEDAKSITLNLKSETGSELFLQKSSALPLLIKEIELIAKEIKHIFYYIEIIGHTNGTKLFLDINFKLGIICQQV